MSMSNLFLRKPYERLVADARSSGDHSLHRALGAWQLTALGIGAIIGTGIFVLTGVAAVQHAGPGVIASFAVAGVASALAALCYAEFATMIPISGSAYSYAYATLGELFAWIIGWDLVLEYAVAAAAVASGWSGYFLVILQMFGIQLPELLTAGAFATAHGLVNLPAVAVLLTITVLLVVGIRESASTNAVIVVMKTAVVLFVIVAGSLYVQPQNWQPFAPFGWSGIMAGGAIVFFAYIGFDAVTTAAEESRRPERDMPIGILGSLAICTVLYILVAAVITGMVPISRIDTAAPLARAFSEVGLALGAQLISWGAIFGLTSVLLVLLLGQSRIFFAMSRDGLLPAMFARIHPRFRTPHVSTLLVGGLVALTSGVFSLNALVELVSIGTLAAFVMVSAGVIALRRLEPDRPRPFRCPFVPWLPLAAIASCFYLMASLPWVTWLRFALWLAVGLVIYAVYGMRHSRVRAHSFEAGA
jgi:APA family basic amino acid/polyamine antiporter